MQGLDDVSYAFLAYLHGSVQLMEVLIVVRPALDATRGSNTRLWHRNWLLI